MGGSQSSEIPGGSTKGYHVIRVLPNSPGQLAQLEPYFDFIISAAGKRLDVEDDTLINLLNNNVDKPLSLSVYNLKTNQSRDTILVPSNSWGGHGLLGVSIRFCAWDAILETVWHILEVQPNSPASAAGLISDSDYIVGTDSLLEQAEDLYELIESYEGHPLRLYVYNTVAEDCREVKLTPNNAWGGSGSVGCGIAFGYLHRIPVHLNSACLSVKTIPVNDQVISSAENPLIKKEIATMQTLVENEGIDSAHNIASSETITISREFSDQILMNNSQEIIERVISEQKIESIPNEKSGKISLPTVSNEMDGSLIHDTITYEQEIHPHISENNKMMVSMQIEGNNEASFVDKSLHQDCNTSVQESANLIITNARDLSDLGSLSHTAADSAQDGISVGLVSKEDVKAFVSDFSEESCQISVGIISEMGSKASADRISEDLDYTSDSKISEEASGKTSAFPGVIDNGSSEVSEEVSKISDSELSRENTSPPDIAFEQAVTAFASKASEEDGKISVSGFSKRDDNVSTSESTSVIVEESIARRNEGEHCFRSEEDVTDIAMITSTQSLNVDLNSSLPQQSAIYSSVLNQEVTKLTATVTESLSSSLPLNETVNDSNIKSCVAVNSEKTDEITEQSEHFEASSLKELSQNAVISSSIDLTLQSSQLFSERNQVETENTVSLSVPESESMDSEHAIALASDQANSSQVEVNSSADSMAIRGDQVVVEGKESTLYYNNTLFDHNIMPATGISNKSCNDESRVRSLSELSDSLNADEGIVPHFEGLSVLAEVSTNSLSILSMKSSPRMYCDSQNIAVKNCDSLSETNCKERRVASELSAAEVELKSNPSAVLDEHNDFNKKETSLSVYSESRPSECSVASESELTKNMDSFKIEAEEDSVNDNADANASSDKFTQENVVNDDDATDNIAADNVCDSMAPGNTISKNVVSANDASGNVAVSYNFAIDLSENATCDKIINTSVASLNTETSDFDININNIAHDAAAIDCSTITKEGAIDNIKNAHIGNNHVANDNTTLKSVATDCDNIIVDNTSVVIDNVVIDNITTDGVTNVGVAIVDSNSNNNDTNEYATDTERKIGDSNTSNIIIMKGTAANETMDQSESVNNIQTFSEGGEDAGENSSIIIVAGEDTRENASIVAIAKVDSEENASIFAETRGDAEENTPIAVKAEQPLEETSISETGNIEKDDDGWDNKDGWDDETGNTGNDDDGWNNKDGWDDVDSDH